jgi:AhpD family alkylhydroperoxidase
MKARLDVMKTAPKAVQAMLKLEDYVKGSGLEPSLYELIKIRASQINGCAFCRHMHTRDARAAGEIEERIDLLPAWRESPLYSPRERAALAWTEAVTRIADTRAPDTGYEELATHFSDEEQVNLTLMIGAINVWNRLSIGIRTVHPVAAPVRAAA